MTNESELINNAFVKLLYSENIKESFDGKFEQSMIPKKKNKKKNDNSIFSTLYHIPTENIPNDLISSEDKIEKKGFVILQDIPKGDNKTLVSVNDTDLEKLPTDGVKELFDKMAQHIDKTVLYESMNTSVLPPNKPTKWVASTTGTTIHLRNYMKFLITKTGDGKFFKRKIGGKVSAYSVAIVIDRTTTAFNYLNARHTLDTILVLVSVFSEIQVSAVDIWVASDKIIRIITGGQSCDIWSEQVITNLMYALLTPVKNTCIDATIERAASTCGSRPSTAVMFVLTDGITEEDKRKNIMNIMKSCEVQFYGIGLGYSVHDVEGLFTKFIWSPQVSQLKNAIDHIERITENKEPCVKYASPEGLEEGVNKAE